MGKFEYEVTQLPPDEFARWLAYFRIKEKERVRMDKRQVQKIR